MEIDEYVVRLFWRANAKITAAKIKGEGKAEK